MCCFPQVSSGIVSENNYKDPSIATPIDLSGNNMKDPSFIKLGAFYIDVKRDKEEDDSILLCMLISKGIHLFKKA